MNEQSRKRMCALVIFFSLLLNSMASILAIANTDTCKNYNSPKQTRYRKKNDCCKQTNCCTKPKPCKDETFDFVIVGAGNAGCVLANRLSENGKFTVCLLEAGRDDARLPDLLPEPSAANVAQPGDYHWGKYVRGGTFLAGSLINRGFGDFHFYENSDNRPDGTRSMTYSRYAGWGGCTSHNGGSNARNAPYNWNQWVELGLTEWDASSPTSPIVSLYKKIENRSQALLGTFFPFYDPGFPGEFGGFDPAWYGFDGQVPMAYTFPDDYTNALLSIINTTLSNFGYPPSFVDLDYPPTAHDGGLGLINITAAFQILDPTVTKPTTAPAPGDFSNNVPMPEYNFPLYGDTGFKVPEEFQDLNNPFYNPAALFFIQRVSSANTYLYEAEQRTNLTIKSEVLVTNLIIKNKKTQGVEYLEGWNIYQTGRNPATSQAGYGGTVGDAKYNAHFAKKKGKRKVFARKAVILSAGAFNTPQILMLSGIGNKFDLEPLGIKSVLHLPGVGEHLIDNQELIMFWEKPAATPAPGSSNTLAAFTKPTDKALGIPPMWDVDTYGSNFGAIYCEAQDPFVQKGYVGLKNVPGIYNLNVRNTFDNILLNTVNLTANPGPITVISASDPIAPIPPETGPWAVTFTIPESLLSEGGFTVRGNSNPNYNGKFTSTVFGNNVIDNSITLLYPTDPGVFGGGTTTITGDPAFLPIMINPNDTMGLDVVKTQNNRSQGFVKLQSCDPTVPPLIFLNMLSDPQDLQETLDVMNNTVLPLIEGLQYTTPRYFQNLLYPAPSDILVDGTDPLAPFSTANVDQAKLKTFILNSVTGHHAMGTCKMGITNDPMAVVDQHGKVFGIDNLYIADMSIAPVSTRWPNSVAYVIGEKIAQDILAAYG